MNTRSINRVKQEKVRLNLKLNWPLYVMLMPALVLLAIFAYSPMYGIVIAFKQYTPISGIWNSDFVGLKYFYQLFSMPDIWQIIQNTIILAVGKIVFGTLFSIIFSLLLNEVRFVGYKRMIQTIVYLPHFLSWVIIGGVFIDLLSGGGLINTVLTSFGFEKVLFLGSNKTFRGTMIATDVWKTFGWSSIIYLSALTAINQELYESAMIDGANRWKQTLHITLPGIAPTIILLACLNLGNVLNAGFEQILVLYSPVVYETGDILDTYLYRTGLIDAQFSLATAVGLLKSAVGFVLIALSYRLAYRYAGYTIF